MQRPELNTVIDIIKGAGEIVRSHYGRAHQIEHKGVIDLVTETDMESEAFILRELARHYPSHSVVAEESGAAGDNTAQRWYIDPVDGTTNFAHHIPVFAVSMAYEENGRLTMGVIYEPMRDELFTAERGGGFHINGVPARVSDKDKLIESLLVTGFRYDIQTNPDNNLDHFAHFATRVLSLRRLGSAALDIAYVAAGRFDAYWELGIKPWDIAAGIVMVEEAGGIVTDLHGGSDYFKQPYAIVASNGLLHDQIIAELHRSKD